MTDLIRCHETNVTAFVLNILRFGPSVFHAILPRTKLKASPARRHRQIALALSGHKLDGEDTGSAPQTCSRFGGGNRPRQRREGGIVAPPQHKARALIFKKSP